MSVPETPVSGAPGPRQEDPVHRIYNLMISCGQPTKGSPPAWGLNEGLTCLAVKPTFYEMTHIILDLNHLERRKERRMDEA